jgi:RNA polymerase sigma-70 factor (ECF subfamily)
MVAFQEGDPEACDELYRRYSRHLINYFYKQSYDRAIAEDLTQETFLRLVRHRAKYRPEASFRTYLFTVARNLYIDHFRSKKAAPKAVSTDLRVGEDGAAIGDLIENRDTETVKQIEDSEAAGIVRTALEDLPEAQREAWVLVFDRGLKYREVASVLGVPVGTVKSRVNAAVVRLRGKLGHVLG